MRIVDDDVHNSLQGELVAKLNAELQKDPAGKQIEVHAGRKTVEESDGLVAAHGRARATGQPLNAQLVIWGRKIGDKKFYPRITVVNAPNAWSVTSERTHDVEKIDELQLPEELVDEPFYLIHFAAGYSYLNRDNYKEALPHFEVALRRHGGLPNEIADLQFFTGFCAYALSDGQTDISVKFRKQSDSLKRQRKLTRRPIRKHGHRPRTTLERHMPTCPRAILPRICKRPSPTSRRHCG
jgi:hypothetical protein